MAVTLAQAKLNAQDDVQAGIIDEFRKSSAILDRITFDDVVTPGTGGASLVYGYTRITTERGAAFRAYGADYTPAEAVKTRYTTELKVLGGAFEIDRVLARVGGLIDEVELQTGQLIKAARAQFHDAVINGDSGADVNAFDGLDVALTGTTTEVVPNSGSTFYTDWSNIATQADAFAQLEIIDDWLSLLDGTPGAIFGNRKSINRFKFLARWAGYLTETEDAFGRKVDNYDGIPLVDLGDKPASTNPIIAIETRDPDGGGAGGNITGLTDLYAVRFGLDGFHGASLAGVDLVHAYLDEFRPDYRQSGVTRKGEVEMVVTTALKASKAAAVLRNVKVQ